MPSLSRRLSRVLTAMVALTWAAVGLVAAAPVHAAEQPVQLSAKPVNQPGQYFDLTLRPGQTRQLQIALGNHGTSTIAARTYAADVYTIINGGFGARLRDDTPGGTTAWLDYPSQVLTLLPGRATVRTFTVTVPSGTPAGEYITSLILENNAPIKGEGSVRLDQVVRQAVAVAVRVPGPLHPGLTIGHATHKLSAGRSVIGVEVSNTGNMRLTPSARLVLHDHSGAVVSRAKVAMDSFYAKTATKVEITLATALDPGKYTVDLSLDDPDRDAHATAEGLRLTVAVPEGSDDAAPPVSTQVIDVLQGESGPVRVWAFALFVLAVCLVATLITVRRMRGRRQPATRGRRRATEHTDLPARPAVAQILENANGTVSPTQVVREATSRQPRRRGSRRAPKHRGRRRVGV